MPTHHPTTRARVPADTSEEDVRARPSNERGFTLIEILVVLVIIAILTSIAMMSYKGVKRTAAHKAGIAAAASYAEAIESYMSDNAQTAPVLGSPEWPTSTRADRIAGPRDVMLVAPDGRAQPYFPRGAPEPVQDGIVDIGANVADADPRARVFLEYAVTGRTWTIEVKTIAKYGGEPVQLCGLTNGTTLPPGVTKCA